MTILVAYDGSAEAERALMHAAELVGPDGSVSVVNVIPVQSISSRLETVSEAQRDQQREILRNAGRLLSARQVDIEPIAAAGDPVREIREAGETTGAEMIVIGRHHGVHQLVPGSVSARLIRRAPCDVLVVH